MDKQWYETIGKIHLRSFSLMLERSIKIAKENGINPKEISVDALFRVYRGDPPKLTDEQVLEARRLYRNGIGCTAIARRFGVSRETIQNIVYRGARKDVV